MSYRYWRKSHPTWPKKIGDVRGRRVRLLHQLQTKGGEIFSEGLVMRVDQVYRGRLVLGHLTDERAIIRKVDPFDVELLPA